jgi:tRNA (guanine-N7-)-methyltransferase
MGKDIIRLIVTKKEKFTVSRHIWGSREEKEIMHAKTGKPLPEGGLAFLFDTSGAGPGDTKWIFKKHYAASEASETNQEKLFLVETISTDGEFEQRYYLKVSERRGDTLVKLDETSRIFLTPAVRCAVEDLTRRLSERA